MDIETQMPEPAGYRYYQVFLDALELGHKDKTPNRIALLASVSRMIEADGWMIASFSPEEYAQLTFRECYQTERPGLTLIRPIAIDPLSDRLEDARNRISHKFLGLDYQIPESSSCGMVIYPLFEKYPAELIYFRYPKSECFSQHHIDSANEVLSLVPWVMEPVSNRLGDDLPSHLVDAFKLLIQGLDRKTIAGKLSVTGDLISQNTKAIYRHCQVQSQSELIYKFHSFPLISR